MIFTSVAFLVFFVVVYSLYWILQRQRVRLYWLLLASQFFYAWWDWRFLGLMWFAILACHVASLMIERGRYPRLALIGSITSILAVLAVFKYYNFFLDSAYRLLGLLGFSTSHGALKIILPVGISFFTFEAIAYVVDVWRREVKAETNVANTAMYISFFPHLLAGPIIRPHDFLPQLREDKEFDSAEQLIGLKLFLVGFIYKSVFSDNISPFVDEVFGNLGHYDNLTLGMATLGFYAQIYFDFCGYSIMAIGIARMFGYRLMRNFNYPYLARSITEFWRRWHISLSTWLRDYLYIPLGGNRHGEAKRSRNLMLTMLLGGLWHGASWNFVLWGGVHGIALNVHKWFRAWHARIPRMPMAFGLLGVAMAWLVTQGFVYLTWIPFRAQTFADSFTVLSAVTAFRDDAALARGSIPYALLAIPLLVDTFVVGLSADKKIGAHLPHTGHRTAALLMGGVLALLLFMMPLRVTNFIYFQF
jgi:D-alanyl-lipoteichoic acid acyltransferase DltB (MBOAT superfamily)